MCNRYHTISEPARASILRVAGSIRAVQPTIHDVADRARTTPTTVSRVINNSGYVSAKTRAAVLDAIEQLHYVPNANARVLKTKRSHVIGILTGDLFNPYSVALAGAVQAHAEARGYTTFIAVGG